MKIPEQPKGLIETITTAASNIVKKVQRLIRPEKKIHKEVIINAETLETRVAVTEDGKLEEFNIERTTEERLVGSIFKGKVRNLEDGLKAAFVDIGFEKNAFLHYWDIVPNQFDSGVEIVEREGRRAPRPPEDHAEGHSAPLFARRGHHRAGHERSRSAPKARASRPTSCCPDVSSCCCRTPIKAAFPARLKILEERKRLKKILRELHIPDGMGVIMRTAGEGQQLRYFVRDLALLLEEWNERFRKKSRSSRWPPACSRSRT